MEIIIYGAGKNCEKLIEKLKTYPEIRILYIADTYQTGIRHGFELLNIFGKNTHNIPKDTPIIISIGILNKAFNVANQLHDAGFSNIYWYLGKTKTFGSDFLSAECMSLSRYFGMTTLPSLEIHVADFCNLNCAGCIHYSPLFEKRCPDHKKRIEDMEKISRLINHVLVFSLLGGEPLVNPDCVKYVEAARKYFPYSEIQLITNGLLIPKVSDNLLRAIHSRKVTVVISEYEPTHHIIEIIKSRLEEFCIDYTIRSFDKKQKFNRPLSVRKNSMHELCCICDGCVGICDGKIARCPALLYIERFNKKFNQNLPEQGIYNISDFNDGQMLIDKMNERVPLCDYCIKDETDWRSCGTNAKLTDFAATD